MNKSLAAFALVVSVSVSVSANNWPHWLGPNGNNTTTADNFETNISKWDVAWKTDVGKGYSSITVAECRAFTMGHDDEGKETIYCFSASDGSVLWKYSYTAELLPKMHTGGPNASVTIVNDKIVALSKDGQIHCLTSADGKRIWTSNLTDILEIKVPQWGFASSPVLHKGQLLFNAGRVTALDLDSGKPVWTSKATYHPGYTTAVVFAQGGDEFVAALDGKGISILSAKDGSEFDRHPIKAKYDMIATTPTVFQDSGEIFISNTTGGEMLKFDGRKLSQVWASKEIRNKMNNSVVYDDVIYGIDGGQGSSAARLVAVDAKNGSVKWAKEKFGYGNVIGVGGDLLTFTEKGELITVEASSKGYIELGRLQVLGKTCWTPPVYAENRIFVRNDRGNLVCLAND